MQVNLLRTRPGQSLIPRLGSWVEKRLDARSPCLMPRQDCLLPMSQSDSPLRTDTPFRAGTSFRADTPALHPAADERRQLSPALAQAQHTDEPSQRPLATGRKRDGTVSRPQWVHLSITCSTWSLLLDISMVSSQQHTSLQVAES